MSLIEKLENIAETSANPENLGEHATIIQSVLRDDHDWTSQILPEIPEVEQLARPNRARNAYMKNYVFERDGEVFVMLSYAQIRDAFSESRWGLKDEEYQSRLKYCDERLVEFAKFFFPWFEHVESDKKEMIKHDFYHHRQSVPMRWKDMPDWLQNFMFDRGWELDEELKLIKYIFKIEPTMESLMEYPCSDIRTLVRFCRLIAKMHRQKGGLFDVQYGKYRYRCKPEFEMENSFFLGTYLNVDIRLMMGRDIITLGRRFTSRSMMNENKRVEPREPKYVFEQIDMNFLEGNDESYEELLQLAQTFREKEPLQITTHGQFLTKIPIGWFEEWSWIEHGSDKRPKKAIVDNEYEFEGDDEEDEDENKASFTPTLRVFSLERKRWGVVDVRDIKEYVYNTGLVDKIVMPENKRSMLKAVMTAKRDEMVADIIEGKHGGTVILADGPTGVGKTLTAECFSEFVKRPLYVVEMAEIGTSVERLEKALEKIFGRAARWGAILLFDEADIFLAERDLNLERSAVVGIFLRLLDYYSGTMFMTTNRGDIIDPAMRSRVSLFLPYGQLNYKARWQVWKNLMAHGKLTEQYGHLNDRIARLPLNGRQIRNCVRLLAALSNEKPLSDKDFVEVITLATGIKETLKNRVRSWFGK